LRCSPWVVQRFTHDATVLISVAASTSRTHRAGSGLCAPARSVEPEQLGDRDQVGVGGGPSWGSPPGPNASSGNHVVRVSQRSCAARLQASGGLTVEVARRVAETGVDFIAAGELTNSARVLDLGLDLRDPSVG
jgi:hypothetical protein